MNDQGLGFGFEFDETSRQDLIAEARRTVLALKSELGPGDANADPAAEAAAALLTQLNEEVAEFGADPDVVPIQERDFTERGLPVPAQFQALSADYRFYWMRLPINLQPLPNMPFNKLECAIEFNPGEPDGRRRARARMILPDRKFQKLLEINDSLELKIGENLEFEASTGSLAAAAGGASVKGNAAADAKVAASLGLVAGPFTYQVKKAQIEHSPAGSEKVFWRLTGANFFQEDDPTLIVVLQVPKGVTTVRTAAALQAYHGFNLGAAGLSDAIGYFRTKVATFFKSGAPKLDKKVWDIPTTA